MLVVEKPWFARNSIDHELKRCKESFCNLSSGQSFGANRKQPLHHYPGLNADSSVTPRAAPARLFPTFHIQSFSKSYYFPPLSLAEAVANVL
jgi:hypothetical protein